MANEACHGDPNVNLSGLVQFVSNHMSRFQEIPGCWPAYIDNPKERIPQLFFGFQELRERIQSSDPIFLDCGSGEGTILSIARFAGFKKTYGIELNPSLVLLSKNNVKELERKKVVNTGCTQIAEGSYYIPELVHLLAPLCHRHLRSLYDQTKDESAGFDEFVTTFLGCSVENFLNPISHQRPYQELGIFDKEKMKLKTDVVYIYSSDPFFESAFLPQAAHILIPSALLVALSPIDDTISDIPQFIEESPIVLSHNSDVNMVLQIFRRDPQISS